MQTLDSDQIYIEETARLNEIYNRKKQQMESQGKIFNQTTIAKMNKWTQPNVSAYLSGKVKLKDDSAIFFAKALGVSVADFSPRLAKVISQKQKVIKTLDKKDDNLTYLPLLSKNEVLELYPLFKDQDFFMPFHREMLPILLPNLSDKAFCYQNTQNAISEIIAQDSLVIIDPDVKPEPDDIVLATNGYDLQFRAYCVTEIARNGIEHYQLKPTNAAYPTLDHTTHKIIGTAVSFLQYLKRLGN